ncbi:MAG TPA: hypothetical protein VNN79_21390, partial [Actinomycetota bacterium]|nr:hypothetical protein [Actinomycetota bacterium]
MRDAKQVLDHTWWSGAAESESAADERPASSTAKQVRRGISDQSGKIRPDLYLKSVRATQRMPISPFLHPPKSHGAGLANASVSAAQAPITGSQWTQIGPGPLRTGSGGAPDPNVIYSGEIVDIAISPEGTTDQILYVATNDGGIWKTDDGGTTWNTTTDNMPSLSMGAVAIDPTNPADVWAGTGDYFDGGGFYSGNGAFTLKAVGLYQSVDAGATWSVVNPGGIFTGQGIQKIVFPGAGQLLVATTNGLFYSSDNGANFGNNSPSFNNGSAVLGGFITDLAMDTTAANTVIAAVSGTGLFQSTNGGQTWPGTPFFTPTTSVGPPAVTAGIMTFAQSTLPNNQTIYVNVAQAGFFRAGFNGVYKSTAGTGGPFTQILTTPPTGSCFCGYSVETAVDPQDATRVYLGYINVFRSTSGGVPAGSFSNQSGTTVHADQHGFAFSPATHYTPTLGGQTQMWTGEDGGIAVTNNGGNSFANKQGTMSTLLFNGIDIGRGSSANRAYSYGGTQDNGTPARQPGMSGTDWTLNTCCDSGPSAVDPTNGQHAIGSFNGGLQQTTNGGDSWSTPAEGGIPANSTFGDNTARQTLAFDPNANTMYAAVGTDTSVPLDQGPDVFGLYRSTDNGATFTQMGTGASPFPTNSYPRAIATTKADSNTMWVALDNGQVWRTSNLGAGATSTWTQLTVTGAPGLPIEGLALDPTNSQIAVAVYSGFSSLNPANRTKHVFRTTNNGASWTDISGTNGGDPTQNFPDVPARGVVIDAGISPHQIIVSTDTSVLRTLDNGSTWSRLGVGFPNVSGNTLSFDPSATPPLLRVGTYGRSAFELTASTGPALAVNGDLNFDRVAVGR